MAIWAFCIPPPDTKRSEGNCRPGGGGVVIEVVDAWGVIGGRWWCEGEGIRCRPAPANQRQLRTSIPNSGSL